MKILIKNGTLINPMGEQGVRDIAIENGIVSGIGCFAAEGFDTVIDASGLAVFPGLIDMHCHLRDPGFPEKEDVLSGTAAAVKGGFTAVACMPNTNPVLDSVATLQYIREKEKNARVYPIAAITKAQKDLELTDFAALREAGAVAFSDDGKSVLNPLLMRSACEKAKGALLISHCEEPALVNGGVMNEGERSKALGLPGITRAAEEVMTARDIILAETFGAKLHIAHVSTRGAAQLVREAKARGVDVSAETCPHYFSADESWVTGDANAKMNPPLRTKDDVLAIREALWDGTIDVIATDHAPHTEAEKAKGFINAPMGIIGLETAFPLALQYSGLPVEKVIEKMSCNPARRLGVQGGVIQAGAPADIAIASLQTEYVLTKELLASKSSNTPFLNKTLRGKVLYTLVGGAIKLYKGETESVGN